MIGTSEQPALKAKAAESKGLLQFVEHLMQKLIPRFEAQANMKDKHKLAKLLWESTKAALSFEKALKTDGRFMTRLQVLEALSSYKRFLVLYEKAGGPISPKCHLMYHLIQNCMAKGNPQLTGMKLSTQSWPKSPALVTAARGSTQSTLSSQRSTAKLLKLLRSSI